MKKRNEQFIQVTHKTLPHRQVPEARHADQRLRVDVCPPALPIQGKQMKSKTAETQNR